jgi:alpha-L-arabinofuranosidase B-like protein
MCHLEKELSLHLLYRGPRRVNGNTANVTMRVPRAGCPARTSANRPRRCARPACHGSPRDLRLATGAQPIDQLTPVRRGPVAGQGVQLTPYPTRSARAPPRHSPAGEAPADKTQQPAHGQPSTRHVGVDRACSDSPSDAYGLRPWPPVWRSRSCRLASRFATAAAAHAADGVAPPRPQGPCDIYAAAGTPCVAAHSTTRALYASYNGPLYRVMRLSDKQVKDVGVIQPVALPFPMRADTPTRAPKTHSVPTRPA